MEVESKRSLHVGLRSRLLIAETVTDTEPVAHKLVTGLSTPLTTGRSMDIAPALATDPKRSRLDVTTTAPATHLLSPPKRGVLQNRLDSERNIVLSVWDGPSPEASENAATAKEEPRTKTKALAVAGMLVLKSSDAGNLI